MKILGLFPVNNSVEEYFLVISSLDNFSLPFFKLDVSYDNQDFSNGQVFNFSTQSWVGYKSRWAGTFKLELNGLLPAVLKIKLVNPPENLSNIYLRIRYKDDLNSSSVSEYKFEDSIDLSPFFVKEDVEGVDVGFNSSSQEDPSKEGENLSNSLNKKDTKIENSDTSFKISTIQEASKDQEYVDPPDSFKPLSSQEKGNIFVTEFMPNPKEGNEWVELYNNNDHSINLNDWFIDDILNGGGSPVKFNLEIGPKSFVVLEIEKSLLNNSGDTVSLLDENSQPLYQVSYKKTVKGSSIQKLSNGVWYITSDFTKNKPNLNFSEVVVDNFMDFVKDSSTDQEVLVKQDKSSKEDTKDLLKDKNESSFGNSIGVSAKEKGEVLGTQDIINFKKDIVYKKVPYYKREKPFTVSLDDFTGDSSLIVLTEKQEPSPYKLIKQTLINTFKK